MPTYTITTDEPWQEAALTAAREFGNESIPPEIDNPAYAVASAETVPNPDYDPEDPESEETMVNPNFDADVPAKIPNPELCLTNQAYVDKVWGPVLDSYRKQDADRKRAARLAEEEDV